ncbi:hypothetical protein [Paenibacillus sp. sptzw28]|uniref:hypothetical protein n=1 Tax=Paenibacillus sp. sptzw28 TaxID=715179 RepID=UPI0037C5AE76
MGLWTKQQLRQFIKENKLVSAQDAQNALKELFAETLQEMLEAEMDEHLGYEKHVSSVAPATSQSSKTFEFGSPSSFSRADQANDRF